MSVMGVIANRILTWRPLARCAPAPAFDLPLFRGGRLSLSSSKGSVTVLNFWASWCVPCRIDMPDRGDRTTKAFFLW